ncbi:ATPase domain-containing protein [Halalkalicoccus sp. NIPERK01]|uniref:RAD55 family ATPase n=1 Tax=Halalkalicoccus sp. NIPERK01 TaxID=3053469 RepID=UPI00256F3279|nr:ATPase domain-containing protein [Halalkalicoccus sp. NIPERK01]MDL5361085.1 ATPase domain-containing protein [Halalkalicoccus sp. NIPERK01]
MVDITETGIEGLDSILNGGLVTDSTVLVSGTPGTGKTILGIQYLYHGTKKFDESGIYLTFEEDATDVKEAAESLGFDDWGDLVERGDIAVYDKELLLREEDFSTTLDTLLEEFERTRYDRLVVDSLTMLSLFFDTEREKRTYLLKFSDILKRNGLTTLFVTEQGARFPNWEIGLENFLTDGNIYLIQTPTDSGVNRYIWVAKMRKRPVETDIFPIDIGPGGITVHDRASGFSFMGDEGAF